MESPEQNKKNKNLTKYTLYVVHMKTDDLHISKIESNQSAYCI